MDEVLKLASTQGIWSLLTVVLLIYILRAQEERDKKQEKREKNYQIIISKLTDKFNIVEDVKKDIDIIKNHIL
ncbi:BhlA/UviB family holin-like peptide [Planotetraspora mira]|uniref:BhlA/UviB family holin-like peptide n=1 Tax=Planotetraspora mira TaxID=58121 RepID=UPI00366C74D3